MGVRPGAGPYAPDQSAVYRTGRAPYPRDLPSLVPAPLPAARARPRTPDCSTAPGICPYPLTYVY
jgi:hypothetical protein